jgi:hypothetical protein
LRIRLELYAGTALQYPEQLAELSPILGDGLKDQAAAVWD